jgi:hypothetical protein
MTHAGAPVTYAAAHHVAYHAPDAHPQAVLKMELGDWQICEDAQGEYYVHAPTGQTYDHPPPELLELHQASQWQHAVQHPAAAYAAPMTHAAPMTYAAAPMTYAAAPVAAHQAAPMTYAAPTMTFSAAPVSDAPAPLASTDSMLQTQPQEQVAAPVVNSAPPPAEAADPKPKSKKKSTKKKSGCC